MSARTIERDCERFLMETMERGTNIPLLKSVRPRTPGTGYHSATTLCARIAFNGLTSLALPCKERERVLRTTCSFAGDLAHVFRLCACCIADATTFANSFSIRLLSERMSLDFVRCVE